MVSPTDHPLLPLATALAALGYRPPAMLWDATLRLAQAPDVARDVLSYVEAGSPRPDYTARAPEMLFKPLPGERCVASLMCDFQLQAVGAFLLAAELVVHPAQGTALLNYFLHRGYWKTHADGSRDLTFPSAVAALPNCPQCLTPWFNDLPRCPICGFVRRQVAIEDGPLSAANLSALLASEALPDPAIALKPPSPIPTTTLHCQQCHGLLRAGDRFCPHCGAPVTPTTPPKPPVCPQCGHTPSTGAKFCGNCGFVLENKS